MSTKAEIILSASDQTKAAFQSVIGNLSSLDSKVKTTLAGIAAGFAAGLSGAVLKGKFDDIIAGAAKLDDLAEITGASVESLSRLAPVAKLAGIDLETVVAAMSKMTKGLAGIGDGDGEGGVASKTAAALKKIGVSATDLTGKLRNPAEMVIDVAQKFGKMADSQEKVQLAQAIFLKGGEKILPFLKDLYEAGDLVAKVTAEQAAQAEQYEKTQMRLTFATQAWQKEVAFAVMPAAQGLVEVLLAMSKETGSVGEKVKGLKENGSLAKWGREGALAIAFVIDAARGAVGAISAISASLPMLAAGGELAMIKLRNAVDHKMSPAAKKIMEDSARGRLAAATSVRDAAITRMLDQQSAQSALEAKFAEMANRPALTGGPKGARAPSIADASGAAAAQKEYDRLIASIREKIAVQDLEYASDIKLTEGQKLASKIMVDLRDGKIKLTDTQKIAVAKGLEELIVIEKRNDQVQRLAKAEEDYAKAREAMLDSGRKQLDQLGEQNQQMRLHNEEIGLTDAQLGDLQIRRAEDAANLARQTMETMRNNETSQEELDIMEKRIKLLDERAGLTRSGVNQKRIADEGKKAEEEWKRTSDNIERSLTDALMRGFENGKSSAQNFRDTLKNMINTLVLRPIIEAPIKPFAEGLSKMVSGAGGVGGLFSGLFGGGGSSQAGSGYNFVNEGGYVDYGVGFAHGGSFQVGGSGGTDSQMVAFRASPDERVTIETPGQRGAQGGGGAPTIIINNTINPAPGNDRNALQSMAAQIKSETIREISARFSTRGFRAEGAALA